MKNVKRILCAFLSVALLTTSLLTMPIFADETATETTNAVSGTAFSDITGTEKYAEAVIVLNKLSIINGYQDGTFKPESNVTRAEFAALLLRMLGVDQTTAPLTEPFPDVSTTYWAAGTIEASKRLGIITGYPDGTFGPTKNVSYEEALAMIIRSIGYENYSAPGDTWYQTYVTSANRLKITENAVGAVGTPATRACIAQFIYDTLSVNSRQDDMIMSTTIMEDRLGIQKADGIIASNSYTSLESPDVNLKENEVLIKDSETGEFETFSVSSMKEFDEMFGAEVTYYYRSNLSSAYDEIIMIRAKKTLSTQTINASLLDDDKSTPSSIAYYKSEKASSVSKYGLDDENVVIYNGKLYGNTAETSRFSADMLPLVGSVTLLNRDGDSDYDVVFIDSYELYAVSSVASSTYTVTDKITSIAGKSKALDYTNDDQIVTFVSPSGAELSFSSIKKNTALCIKESNDNSGTKMITVVIMNNNVTGEVKATSSKGLTVGSTEYKYSMVAPWETGDEIAAPEKDSTYTFLLDVNGEIFAYIKDETAQAKVNYGYIIDHEGGDGSIIDDSPAYLQILTQSGAKQWIPLYKSTKIDGSSINGDYNNALLDLAGAAELQALKHGGEGQGVRQLIKYSLKSVKGETVFDTIVTVTDDSDMDGGDADDETLRMFGGFSSADNDITYTSSSKVFKANGNSIFLGSAVVFVVPDDMTETESYRKGSSSDFKNNRNYNIEVFDMTAQKNARVIVLYGGNSTTEVDSNTAAFRFEEYTEERNSAKDKTMLKVVGYENGSTSTTEYWVSPSSESLVEDLVEGDVVRFGKDADGFATLAEIDILYKVGETDPYYFAWEEDYVYRDDDRAKEKPNSDIKVVLGTLHSVEEGIVIIAPDPEDDTTDLTLVLRASTSAFSGANFYEYDTSANPTDIVHLGTGAEVFDNLTSYTESADDAQTVFVHMVSGSVKTVIVIE